MGHRNPGIHREEAEVIVVNPRGLCRDTLEKYSPLRKTMYLEFAAKRVWPSFTCMLSAKQMRISMIDVRFHKPKQLHPLPAPSY